MSLRIPFDPVSARGERWLGDEYVGLNAAVRLRPAWKCLGGRIIAQNAYTACVADAVDIAIIGAGAAGLMAAIWAGRTGGHHNERSGAKPRIVVLDGAKHLGAKILVAGGGRCNVTHDVVDERAFAGSPGSSRHAIKKVLRRFDVGPTIEFFRELGVELKREETGKLFPTTDKARTVLDALLEATRQAGVEIHHPWRVETVTRQREAFSIRSAAGDIDAHKVIVATGGRSLPKTGSDGHGNSIAQSLGHSISSRVFPALVPLTLPSDHFLCGLTGVSAIATLEVRSGTGKKLISFTDSLLCTHFGLSGPAVLDISRYLFDARMDDAAAQLVINWLAGETVESVDAGLQDLGKISPGRWLRERNLPQRLAEALCAHAGVDASTPAHQLTRDRRRGLANAIANLPLPITGDRGFAHAEVTAGGVPLSELRLETMESRICPGLHIIGEICDVDGRIGGYNFQWAWASGFVAGVAAASAAAAKVIQH
jgi:predicted Rossmann fold flavoprotein